MYTVFIPLWVEGYGWLSFRYFISLCVFHNKNILLLEPGEGIQVIKTLVL